MIIHNVRDRRNDWIGSWEAEPLDIEKLTEADVGRTVIFQSYNDAEAGTLVSWRDRTLWARFSKGDTAASCRVDDLAMAVRPLDGNPNR